MKSLFGGLLISTLMISPCFAVTNQGLSKDDSFEVLKQGDEKVDSMNQRFHAYTEITTSFDKENKFCFLSDGREQCFVGSDSSKIEGITKSYPITIFYRNIKDPGDVVISKVDEGNCLVWDSTITQCHISYKTKSGKVYYNTVDFKSNP